MGIQVRILDVGAVHLKKNANDLGRQVISKGGGSITKILDGFIVRAVGNTADAVVTILGMDAAMGSYGYRIFTLNGTTGYVQENRQVNPVLRGFFNGDNDYAIPFGGSILDGTKFGYDGDAIGLPPTVYEAAYSRRCVTVQGVTTGAQINTPTKLHIRRSVVGNHWEPEGPSGPTYLPPGSVASKGRTMFVTPDLSGVVDSLDNEVACVSPQVAELRDIFVGVCQVGHRETPAGQPTQFVPTTFAFGCRADYETSTVSVVWSSALPSPAGFSDDAKYVNDQAGVGVTGDQSAYVLAATEAQVLAAVGRHTIQYLAAPELVVSSIAPQTGATSTVVFALEDRRVAHPWGVAVGGLPYIFAPTTMGRPDPSPLYPGGLLFDETYASDLGAVLVTPALQMLEVDTPGYFIQPGVMDARYGAVVAAAEGPSRRKYAVDYLETPMYGSARGCEYAPGLLAVVLIPTSEFAATYHNRYLGVIDLTTGGLVRVSAAPICPPGSLWQPVNLSCVESGRTTDGVFAPPTILVASYGIESSQPFDWNAVGLWVTRDGGDTREPAYPEGLPASVKQQLPIINATYLGSPLLPAAVGQTRRQWYQGSG